MLLTINTIKQKTTSDDLLLLVLYYCIKEKSHNKS